MHLKPEYMFDFSSSKTLIKNNEIVIASVIGLLFVAILTFMLLIPNFNQSNSLNKSHRDFINKFEILTNKNSILGKIDKAYYMDVYPKLTRILPDAKDYVSLFSTFDSLQSKTGVAILRTDFQLGIVSTESGQLTKDPDSPAYTVPMVFEVLGGLEQIKEFIGELNSYTGRLITVDNIRLEMQPDETIKAIFTGKAYFYPLPKSIGDVYVPLPTLNQSQVLTLENINESQPQIASSETDEVPIGVNDLFMSPE